jgi:hypothetical protein
MTMLERLRKNGLLTMAAPMTVWALHFAVIYSLVGLACERGWTLHVVAGLNMLVWQLAVLCVVTLAVLAWLALRAVSASKLDAAVTSPAGQDVAVKRRRFVARVTLSLCLLAAVAVLFTTIPAFLVPTCA